MPFCTFDHGGTGRVRDEDTFDVEGVAIWLSGVFALFRPTVIAQRTHSRYFHGQTNNDAYAELGDGARNLRRLSLVSA